MFSIKDILRYAADQHILVRALIIATPVSVAWYLYQPPCWSLSVLGFALYVFTGGWKTLWIVYKTLGRDARGLVFVIGVGKRMRKLTANNATVYDLFRENVRKHPNKIAFYYQDESYTFVQAEEMSNQVAHYFIKLGYKKGDVVALFMESRPEFIMIWLGLSKLGVVTALINFNLRSKSLCHSINVSGCKAIIFSNDLAEAITEVTEDIAGEICYYSYNEPKKIKDLPPCQNIVKALAGCSKEPPEVNYDKKFTDPLIYIYTSGTTGMPKASIITNCRFFFICVAIGNLLNIGPDDSIYCSLPIYHSAGGILGVGNCLITGCTLVLRKKFSASNFWADCIKYKCTIIQYIGETCRYLLAQPKSPLERSHHVRLAVGNGLRPNNWNEFQNRYQIKQIGEFYGSTEGNANMVNTDNTPFAVGFNSALLPWVYPIQLIRIDEHTRKPIRGSNGLCARCKPGEPGELVGKITTRDLSRKFEGYVDESATKKKIIQDVFRKGDSYFATGDILMKDDLGYMYFVDRTGDTFRWKGENVSTTEVENTILSIVGLRDVAVFGVQVGELEGQAGMAAISDPNSDLDIDQLTSNLKKLLPNYARPVFVRLLTAIDQTSTYKLVKTRLKAEGYDPNTVGADKIYYFDATKGKYERLNLATYKAILSGAVRV